MSKIKDKWQKIPLTVKVSTAYVLCGVLQKCILLITLPLFTRLLTVEQYGQVTIYSSWQGILSIFLTLNLAYGSFSTAMVKFEEDRDGYISAIEGICVVLSGVFLLVYLPFQDLWNKLFELPTYIMCIMVVEMLGTTALLLWSGKKRFDFKFVGVVAITLGVSIVSPIIQYILVITHDEKGYARIIGAAIVNVVVGCVFFFRNIMGKKMFNKEYWKYALGFNIPLFAYYMSEIIFNQSDRIMISHMLGTDKAAIYGVAYNLAIVLTFVLNAINNAYVPWYYGKIKSGKIQDNKTVSLKIAGLMALLLLGVIWFAPEIILILAGQKYMQAVYVVPPVAISLLLLFYGQLFIDVELYFEEKKKMISASLGAAVINLTLNWIFIRWFGFLAAAYTTLIAYIVFVLANYGDMRQILKDKNIKDNGFDYKGLIALFLIFSVISYLGVALYKLLLPRILVCVVVLGIIIINRNSFLVLIKDLELKTQKDEVRDCENESGN